MKIDILYAASNLLLSTDDIAAKFGITTQSAQVYASRNVKKGNLIRLKRDMFIVKYKFDTLTEEELFRIAALLQTPSYISLTSALSYYNISTQQLQDLVESIAVKRTKRIDCAGTVFNFSTVKKCLFTCFVRKETFFLQHRKRLFLMRCTFRLPEDTHSILTL